MPAVLPAAALHLSAPPRPGTVTHPDPIPLVVDLDGTLLRTDLLIESIFVLAKQKPLELLMLPLWLAQGRARLKQRLADEATPDIGTLPYRPEVLAHLQVEAFHGRRLILATAADASPARAIAHSLGLFDAIFASDGLINLSGERKRDRLIAAFGDKGFDYLGNSRDDRPVWSAARKALMVRPGNRLLRQVTATSQVERVFEDRTASSLADTVQALRPVHWVKNLLILLPLAFAQHEWPIESLLQALLAFAAFCLCASSVYLLNDLLDLRYDRRHPQKKERALASGRLGIAQAMVLIAMLLIGASVIAAAVSPALLAVMSAYYAITLAYSLGIKDVPILDVLVLAAGYGLRVAAGAVALGLSPSEWLLAFCMLFFFSLALVKRYAELMIMGSVSASIVHGYRFTDRSLLAAQGLSTGYLSVLVLALHANGAIVQPAPAGGGYYWAICGLLVYWISYLWLTAHRGRMHHDPVVFALKDRVSLLLLAAMAVLAALAL